MATALLLNSSKPADLAENTSEVALEVISSVSVEPLTPTDVTEVRKVRKVSFYRAVMILLIPCLAEYRAAKLCDTLWYTPADMRGFQRDTMQSLLKFMQTSHVKDKRRALKMLLQEESSSGTGCLAPMSA